jgi:hypothetical protein
MTQPPGGYPPDYGEQHPPPADPFFGPPSWDPPTPPTVPAHSPPPEWYPQPGPPTPPYRPSTGPYPSRRSRHNRRRGLTITLIVLAGLAVLCSVGGLTTWLLTRDPDRNGAEDPVLAVQSFLQAVYRDLDAGAAAGLVCDQARDQEALTGKINELRSYQETYASPSYRWSQPAVVDQTDELAVVEVTVTMTTQDEKTSDQRLRLSVLDKGDNGWWICEVQTVAQTDPAATPTPSATPSATPEGE